MNAIEGTGRGAFLLSCIIHAGLIAVIVLGLPSFLRHHRPAPPQPVPIHIVNAATLPNPLRHDSPPGPSKPGGAQAQPVPPPITGTKDLPNDDKTANMARPLPQQSVEQTASVLAWATGKPQAAPPVKPSQAAEKTAPAQEPQRQAQPVVAPPPPPVSIDDQMDSLVKSLTAQATALETKKKKARRHGPRSADQENIVQQAPPPSLSQPPRQRLQSQLTQDEIDIVRAQVRRCWSYFGNSDRVRGIQVPIHLVLRPDGSVVSARVVDDGHQDDPLWRSVADSALRALQNPNCSPLNLPPAKYDAWRSATFTFNP